MMFKCKKNTNTKIDFIFIVQGAPATKAFFKSDYLFLLGVLGN